MQFQSLIGLVAMEYQPYNIAHVLPFGQHGLFLSIRTACVHNSGFRRLVFTKFSHKWKKKMKKYPTSFEIEALAHKHEKGPAGFEALTEPSLQSMARARARASQRSCTFCVHAKIFMIHAK